MLNFKNESLVILILSIVCLVLAGTLIYSHFPGFETLELTKEDVVNKALAYINENLLSGDTKATSTGEITEEKGLLKGLYKFQVKIGEQEFSSYVTKDGEILFPQAINLEEKVAASQGENQGETPKTCEDIPKNDKPVLEAFVVSFCPFGTQMQRILAEIVKNIPELAENIKIEYMGQIQNEEISSMHGEEEAEENLIQICLREEQEEKFFNYLSCFLREGKTDKCLKEAGIDEEKLSQCMEDSSRGISYASEDFEAQNNYRVTGSPALILNVEEVSEFDFGGRTAEAVKTLLCCGFITEPEFCEKALSEEQAAAGFSETYSSGESGSGACE